MKIRDKGQNPRFISIFPFLRLPALGEIIQQNLTGLHLVRKY
jgi:hypothetical protein